MSTGALHLNDGAMRLLAEDAKIALLATVAEGRVPHLTLITSIQAKTSTRLMFGQFSEGLSKVHVTTNPRVGFLALDRSRQWLRGKALWLGTAKHGEDYETFNRKPLFRYNAYFGIHTVHYLDLVEVSKKRRLKPAPLVAGALLARLRAAVTRTGLGADALTLWSQRQIGHPASLKFLAYVGADGHPSIVPAIAAATRGTDRLVVVPTLDDDETKAIPAGRHVALFALDLEMRSVLVRGVFQGWRGPPGLRSATVDVDWVYNSMPPKHGPIYPRVPLRPIRFSG